MQFVRIVCMIRLKSCTKYSQISDMETKMTSVMVDRYDIDLLTELQRNGRATNSALGEKIHLSTSQVSRRVQRLEETKVISHYAAVLNPEVVGLGVMAFTYITLGRQGEQADLFEQEIADI